jgi:hypothetical protein
MAMDFIPKLVEALAVETICIICVSSKIRDAKFLGKVKWGEQATKLLSIQFSAATLRIE